MAEQTALTLTDFQEKVAERIRASIGDLMPDDLLKGMVERALEESLFKERVVVTPGRASWERAKIETKPAFLPGFVMDLVKERVDTAVRENIAQRSKEIDALIQEEISKGIGEALLKAVRRLFEGDLMQLQLRMVESLNQLAQRR